MSEWREVRNADDVCIGWVQAPDPDEPDIDYFEAARLRRVAYRGAVLGQAADVMADEAFDLAAVWEACEASGMPESDIDAAAYVVYLLRQVEQRYGEG